MTKSLVALVGMKHRGTEALVASLPQGEPLLLIREPDNKFDRFAVQVWAREVHVGYIKSSQVKPIAIAMDAALSAGPGRLHSALSLENKSGRLVMAAALAIDGGKWPLVDVDLTPKREVPDVG